MNDTWPYAKVGEGRPTVRAFLDLHDALQDVTVNPKLAASFCRELAARRTVCLLSRRRAPPSGFTVRVMAIVDFLDAEDDRASQIGSIQESLGSWTPAK